MTSLRAALAGLVCGVALLGSAQGEELTEEEAALAMDFAMHDAAFTVYHEIGHMLVDQLRLPVLGKEEDAVDALATILLLDYKSDEIEAFNTLIDTTDGWYFNAVQSTGTGVEELSYYDEHSLDIQRAYAMVCLMVGASPKDFGETADIYEIDKEQQEACAGTYEQARNSWNTLLAPHAAEAADNRIAVTYDDAGDLSLFADELKSRRVLEKAAELVGGKYELPEPVTIRAALCDTENAFYDSDENEITYCYELASAMHALYVENMESEEAEGVDASESLDGGESVDEAKLLDAGEDLSPRRGSPSRN